MNRWLALFVLLPLSAAAQDAFEIQVYSSETAPPLQVGGEMHLNHFFVGSLVGDGTERPTNRVTHLTLEPHVGIASWCEAGGYFLMAFREDGHFDFAGLKLRFKIRWPEKLWGVLGLSLNQELSMTRRDYEADELGWELRPIIDLEWKRLYLSFNPIVSVPLGAAIVVPELAPSLKGSVRVLDFLNVGAEYYAAFGPINRAVPLDQQAHRLFGALDFEWKNGRQLYELNFAVGYGFTGPEKWIAKLIFEFDYEPLPAGAP